MDENKTTMRLNKYIAAAGIGSRREADRMITAGRVTLNGQPAITGMTVGEGDVVTVNGAVIGERHHKVVLAYNKPVGVTCTARDPHAKEVLGTFDYPVRVTYAGRLDRESEGLLLMTNDGELIDRMMRARNGHEKEYQVKVDRAIEGDFLQRMSRGIYLPELELTTRPCMISATGRDSFTIILTQGVNRQIRRMCKELDYAVIALKRVRVVNICLGEIPSGKYREVTGEELEILYRTCGL
jgi:23S rRNA pseudouridine2604 synthase